MKQLRMIILVCSFVIMAGCSQKAKDTVVDTLTDDTEENTVEETDTNAAAANGDTVQVHYVGKLPDGSVFDTSREDIAQANDLYNPARPYEPLSFTVGAGQMIPGFDAGVVGMKVGDTKTVEIQPADGYGEIKEDLIQDVPYSGFEAGGIEPQVGETYTIGFARGKVVSVDGETVKMDFNHFLAGKVLVFDIEMVQIN